MISIAPSPFILSSVLFRAFLVLSALWFVKWIWGRRKLYALSYKLPGPFALPFLGNVVQILCFGNVTEKIEKMNEWKETYGSIFRAWFGPDLYIALTSPEDIECILMSKDTSWKGAKYEVLKGFLGSGLLTLSGPKWKSRRHLINPAFSIKVTRNHGPILNECARNTIQSMEKFCDKGFVDVVPFFGRYGGDAVCRCQFDLDFKFYNGETDFVLTALSEKTLIDHNRICKYWLTSDFIFKNSYAGKRFIKIKDDYRKFCYAALETKSREFVNNKYRLAEERTPSEYYDSQINNQSAFGIMMNAVTAGSLSFNELSEEFNNILNPGVESIFSHLSTLVLMMAMHKDCQDRLWQDIRGQLGDDPEGAVSADVITKLPYLDMIIKETIRLFPTGPVLMRHIHTDFYLKSRDITLPVGSTVVLCTYLMFRDPNIWKDPESFIPERFLPEEIAKRPYFAFVPFSAGQRNCIGQAFGVDAVKTLAVQLIRNFEFHSELKLENLRTSADTLSTRSADGYNVQITKRKRNV